MSLDKFGSDISKHWDFCSSHKTQTEYAPEKGTMTDETEGLNIHQKKVSSLMTGVRYMQAQLGSVW